MQNKKLLARVHRIQGQIAALERALLEERDCTEILQQLAASRGAINGLMQAVLSDHLQHHLQVKEGHEESGGMEELLKVLRSYLK